MKWKKVTIETTTEATDMISYVLGEYGVEGIQIEDRIPLSEADKEAMFIDILPELPPDDGVAYISCYIDDSFDIRELCRYMEEQLQELSAYMEVGSGRISIGETEDKDWINNWKDFFHPFRLEENIVIQPTWTEEAEIRQGDVVVKIDPGTSFGTGSHETTKLCISSLKKYICPDGSTEILDAGCGSGILSIIAMKLGAKRVCGVDIDELAVKAARENLLLNQIPGDCFDIVKGDMIGEREFTQQLAKKGQYDIVVANILADVIISLSAVIRPFMKENALFVASGIIDEKENTVKEALVKNGFEIIDTMYMGDWICVISK